MNEIEKYDKSKDFTSNLKPGQYDIHFLLNLCKTILEKQKSYVLDSDGFVLALKFSLQKLVARLETDINCETSPDRDWETISVVVSSTAAA